MTVKQAATHACVSPGLIYAWCADGILPFMRVGRKGKRTRPRSRIAIEDLDGLLASLKVGKSEPASPSTPIPARSAFRHLRLN